MAISAGAGENRPLAPICGHGGEAKLDFRIKLLSLVRLAGARPRLRRAAQPRGFDPRFLARRWQLCGSGVLRHGVGWLIGGILLRTPRRELPRFYFNRALRIWCPYVLALALLLAASALHDPITGKWTEFAFYKASFTYNLFGLQQARGP